MRQRPSALPSLELIGAGTVAVESCTSFGRRVADEFGVDITPLITEVVLPPTGMRFTLSAGETVNGGHLLSRAIAERFATLTERPSVRASTLVDLEIPFDTRGALRRHRAFCGSCLLRDAVPYDRLLFAFRQVTRCPWDDDVLWTHCPHCGEPHYPWGAGVTGAECPHCHRSLAVPRAANRGQPDLHGRVLYDLMSRTLAGDQVTAPAVARSVRGLLDRFGGYVALSRVSGLPKATLWRMATCSEQRVRLVSFVNLVVWASGLLPEFLRLEFVHPSAPATPSGVHRKPPRPTPDKQQVASLLAEALRRPRAQRPTSNAIAAQAHTSTGYLRQHFPERVRRLAGSRVQRSHQPSRRASSSTNGHRPEVLQQRSAAIRRAVLALRARGVRPTYRSVEDRVGVPGLLRAPYAIRVYRDALDHR